MTRTEDWATSTIFDDKLCVFQSLRHKKGELFLLLQELIFPDIVSITEPWLNFDEPVFVKNNTTISRFIRTN